MTTYYERIYIDILNRILDDLGIENFATEWYDEFLERCNVIDRMVQIANSSLNHHLASTQVVSWIVYDFLREKGIIKT